MCAPCARVCTHTQCQTRYAREQSGGAPRVSGNRPPVAPNPGPKNPESWAPRHGHPNSQKHEEPTHYRHSCTRLAIPPPIRGGAAGYLPPPPPPPAAAAGAPTIHGTQKGSFPSAWVAKSDRARGSRKSAPRVYVCMYVCVCVCVYVRACVCVCCVKGAGFQWQPEATTRAAQARRRSMICAVFT